MCLRHDPSVRRFVAWKIGLLTSLRLPSSRFLSLLAADTLPAAAPGFLPPTAFAVWFSSGSSLISSRTLSLTSTFQRSRVDVRVRGERRVYLNSWLPPRAYSPGQRPLRTCYNQQP